MTDTPRPTYAVVHRAAQPAATVTRTVTMATMSEVADELPAGDYLSTVHVGPYDGLEAATGALLAHADRAGLRLDAQPSDAGEVWASRLEWYETNPAEEPDPSRWITRLEFKLAD